MDTLKVKIERYLDDTLQATDVVEVSDFSRFNGPGVTSEVCYDLRKNGKAWSEMPSGYNWYFEVIK